MDLDEYYMRLALQEAQIAYGEGEVPVGAVIVCGQRIAGKGHNRVEALQDPTAHAEILAITAASHFLKQWRLQDCILYVTLEPCLMCAGAILLSRIREVVYALPDPRMGALGSRVQPLESYRIGPIPMVRQGPLTEQVRQLMDSFFRKLRGNHDLSPSNPG